MRGKGQIPGHRVELGAQPDQNLRRPLVTAESLGNFIGVFDYLRRMRGKRMTLRYRFIILAEIGI